MEKEQLKKAEIESKLHQEKNMQEAQSEQIRLEMEKQQIELDMIKKQMQQEQDRYKKAIAEQ